MSLITRTYTFSDDTTAYGSQVESEIGNIVTTLNNLNAGSSSWDIVKVVALTSTGTTVLKGSTTNDSAATGNIGEYSTTFWAAAGLVAATTVYGNVGSLVVGAGDWDICGSVVCILNGATMTGATGAVSLFTGNTTTDHQAGYNQLDIPTSTAVYSSNCSFPRFRVSASGNTTVYLKIAVTFSAGSPQMAGFLSFRRVR